MMENLINEYLNYLSSEDRSDKTISKYKPCLTEMMSYMNFKCINDIEKTNFIDLKTKWINVKKDEGLGNQSLNLRIAACKGFMTYLYGKRLISVNVGRELKNYGIQTKEKIADNDVIQILRTYVKEEYEKNKDFLTLRNYLIINFLLCTGLRNSELRSLNIDSVNPTTGEFTVIGKRKIKKEGILIPEVLDIYNLYLKERIAIDNKAKDDSLFLSKNYNRISSKGLENIFNNICELNNLPHLTPHSMRHICGSSLIDSGVSIEQTAKILGHTNISTCYKWYYHIDDDSRKQAVNKNKIFA